MFPGRVGVNLTATVQLAAGASIPPQGVLVVAMEYSPLGTMLEILTLALLEFVTMADRAVLVVPTTVEGTLSNFTENDRGAVAPPDPVPDRLTTCGLEAPL